MNASLHGETANLSRDNEHTASHNYDERKGVEHANARNADMAVMISDTEIKLKVAEDAFFVTGKDVQVLRQ